MTHSHNFCQQECRQSYKYGLVGKWGYVPQLMAVQMGNCVNDFFCELWDSVFRDTPTYVQCDQK